MPVTVTLQRIKDQSPCRAGWKRVLASRGTNPDYNEPFPLADIITSNCLSHAVWALRCLYSPRIAQQYALDCANMVRHLMKSVRSTNAMAVVARYLEGRATSEEVRAARWDADAYAAAAAAAAAAADAHAYAAAYEVADAAAVAAVYAAAYAVAAADAYACRAADAAAVAAAYAAAYACEAADAYAVADAAAVAAAAADAYAYAYAAAYACEAADADADARKSITAQQEARLRELLA